LVNGGSVSCDPADNQVRINIPQGKHLHTSDSVAHPSSNDCATSSGYTHPHNYAYHYPAINAHSLTSTPSRVVPTVPKTISYQILKPHPSADNLVNKLTSSPLLSGNSNHLEIILDKFCQFIVDLLSSLVPVESIVQKLNSLIVTLKDLNQDKNPNQNFLQTLK